MAALGLLLFDSCSSGPPRAVPIGEAYVGPAVLKIRSDFPLESSAVATVKHGDRLAILQTHRKFIRVRTPDGKEGWADERQLLAAPDMAALRALAERSARLPSQGVAIAYQPLNIHTQPSAGSPSFLQLKENDKVDVLQSVVLARANVPRTPLIPPTPKKTKALPRKATKKQSKVPLPPMPKPPALPPDWVDLSRSDQDEEDAPPEVDAAKPAVPVDGWSLVRTPTGQCGWVLTRLISMGIPDEVAQYAEGRRIVSYFALGEVQDGDQKKNIWLWTTTTDSKAPWDYDSFRVFVWSARRHHYETSYIERSVKGYAPVLLHEVTLTSRGLAGRYPGFSVCTEKKDGQRMRREFALVGQNIRFGGESPCEPPALPVTVQAPAPLPASASADKPPSESLFERLKKRFKRK